MEKDNFLSKIRAMFTGKENNNEKVAETIKGYVDSMGKWKSLIGTLCFNIWHSTKDDFENSRNYLDMEWPFLCGLYIFHHWDNSVISKRYSIPELMKEVDPAVLKFKDGLFTSLPEISSKIDNMLAMSKINPRYSASNFKVEPSKIFISIFNEALMKKYGNDIARTNPMDFFQFGIESLLLFTVEARTKNNKFYNLIEDIGPYETEDAKEVLKQINAVFE